MSTAKKKAQAQQAAEVGAQREADRWAPRPIDNDEDLRPARPTPEHVFCIECSRIEFKGHGELVSQGFGRCSANAAGTFVSPLWPRVCTKYTAAAPERVTQGLQFVRLLAEKRAKNYRHTK